MLAAPQNIACSQLQGVGPKTLERLHKINLFRVQDLLFHLPIRYEDRTKISPIRKLKVGEYAAIVGTIIANKVVRYGRSMLYCTLQDISGQLQICFFNFNKQKLQFKLLPGIKLYCYGELRWVGNTPTMVHPEYKILAPNEEPPVAKNLTPVYPTTDGLSQFVLRKLITQAINIAVKNKNLFEYFPVMLLQQLNFPNLIEALSFVHQPPAHLNTEAAMSREHPMRQRLIFEELLAQQLSLLELRLVAKTHEAIALPWKEDFTAKFLAALPFTLTNAQLRVIKEIASDLAKPKPMLRLLQGDVGCGKTIVAALTVAQAVNHGYQAAILAPTEILAEQHFKNITHLLEPFGINVVLLSGKIKGKKRDLTVQAIADGSTQAIVGTHAIFQEKIKFNHLALVIIDEQHRFGVHQRAQLRDKGFKDDKYPHQLIMTATPIPRTLAMAVYADLDCSIIDELPKGRAQITTIVVSNRRRLEVLAHIRSNCQEGKQAYWVCPLIEESENLQCQAAETLAKELVIALPELRIGLVHGRKSSEQKEKIMAEFAAHKIDLLVATTVIEVGVDVPNASLMIIENAERLGLVQIHQLRGRVGRGTIASFCVLLYQSPLSMQARQRLLLARDTNDGFVLARKDLEMRGAGEVLGTKQTGLLQMRIADLISDQHLIPRVQEVAVLLLREYRSVAEAVVERWVGSKEKYGDVV